MHLQFIVLTLSAINTVVIFLVESAPVATVTAFTEETEAAHSLTSYSARHNKEELSSSKCLGQAILPNV
jgi:hypothetical protein